MGELHIGGLPIRPSPALSGLIGQNVTATGTLLTAGLVPSQVVPDLLASDPVSLFGPSVGFFYIETFAVWQDGRVRFGQGFSAPAPGLHRAESGPAVVELERSGNGLRALGVLPARGPFGGFGPGRGAPAPVSGRQFEPAPMPNRGIGPAGAGGGRFSGQGPARVGARGRPGGQGEGNDADGAPNGQSGSPNGQFGGPNGQFGGGGYGGPGPGGGRGR